MTTIAELMFEAKHGRPPTEEDKKNINEFLHRLTKEQTPEQQKLGKQGADTAKAWLEKMANIIKQRDESLLKAVAEVVEIFNDPITGERVFEFVDMDRLDAKLTVDERKYMALLMNDIAKGSDVNLITVPSIGNRNKCFYRDDVENWVTGSRAWD